MDPGLTIMDIITPTVTVFLVPLLTRHFDSGDIKRFTAAVLAVTGAGIAAWQQHAPDMAEAWTIRAVAFYAAAELIYRGINGILVITTGRKLGGQQIFLPDTAVLPSRRS